MNLDELINTLASPIVNAPIRATIQRINDMDSANQDRIIAEEAKGGWKTRLAV